MEAKRKREKLMAGAKKKRRYGRNRIDPKKGEENKEALMGMLCCLISCIGFIGRQTFVHFSRILRPDLQGGQMGGGMHGLGLR